MKLELFKSKDGWRIRLKGNNGKIIMSSEAYASKYNAYRMACRVKEFASASMFRIEKTPPKR